ncbi:TonB-dependent receptor plug domain-containing protein [Qipengyuania flava]|jgi:iron complex outermembrane receptor protein|uniref:TonB-dependent receptor plug domain-containing protein n=1 Tax=Qipengyuania flava TaxID=192812 RepID=UPI003BAE35EF|tara:strand:+ start:1112 stop:3247 length:2136 start_codon:yes stop_codon:yes gene_type:complete
MKFPFRRALFSASALSLIAAPDAVVAQQSNAPEDDRSTANDLLTDTIIVTASKTDLVQADNQSPPEQIAIPADAAGIAARTPGGALVQNGALSGQLSYRGLFGERVLGRINGQRFASGGPNAMDPPLHYAPSILIDRIEITRGTAPVSQGPSLSAAVNAKLVGTRFSDTGELAANAYAAGQYRSVDNSYAIGGQIGIATPRWRLGVIGSREEGEDYDYAGGTAVGTSFERQLYGIEGGFRAGEGEFFVEYRRSETDPTGNPPFALDIVYFDTDFLQAGFRGQLTDDLHLDLRMGHVAVRHLMDNQTTRQPAAPAMRARATFADADTNTAEVALRFGSDRRNVTVGGDVEMVDKDVTITNPTNAAFFLEAQPNLSSERFGGFVQWRGGIGAAELELGARLDRTSQTAGVPQLGTAVPMGPSMLAAAFAASGREQSDTTVDVVARAWVPMGEIVPRVTLSRRTRVPSLLERFAWLPTEASHGLADGNIYVGNQALEPEVAYTLEAGADFNGEVFTFRPTAYYRRVNDFIQGKPFDATVGVLDTPVEMVANMNGDPTPLTFRNVDAEFYGVDLDFTVRPTARILIDGTMNYVRGMRRDIDDDLYRVPPLNGRISIAYEGDRIAIGGELTGAADQNAVSVSNDEDTSEGYVIAGLFAQFRLSDEVKLEAGVENIFDTFYQPHLAGRNRVQASDVPLGERLPGYGRGVWIRASANF